MAIDCQPMTTSPLPIYDFVMARLRAKVFTQRQIAAGSGVPFSTLAKIAQGSVKEPSVHTIQRLADYFAAIDQAAEPAVRQPPQQAA